MTRQYEICIAGGGLAGSLAAAMLGRAGIRTALIDPHPVYPNDFRCEKFDGPQMRTLALTGLGDALLGASTPDRECWVARFGRVVEKRPGDQQGIFYDALVNTFRKQISGTAEIINAKVTDIVTDCERQTVRMSSGEELSARLVVIATGLNPRLRAKLGIEQHVLSAGHSISIGFDTLPSNGQRFPFPALTYFSENPADRMAYITLFPIGASMRANLFGYRDLHDPWLKQFRDHPRETLYAMWPRLRPLMGDFSVPSSVQIRPIDLYETRHYLRDGVVLVGDAFATSCPAAGTGARKVLVDVERLCNIYIPRWLATAGMSSEKLAGFYGDPVKRACDDYCLSKAYHLRSFTVETTPYWLALRGTKFLMHWVKGSLRRLMTKPAGLEWGAVQEDGQEDVQEFRFRQVRSSTPKK
jgi:2-polyprenyl-6-methoxyphenol hydroxylase-like FAD-dependent oxidoreductase